MKPLVMLIAGLACAGVGWEAALSQSRPPVLQISSATFETPMPLVSASGSPATEATSPAASLQCLPEAHRRGYRLGHHRHTRRHQRHSSPATSPGGSTVKVDLNSATVAELAQLPGLDATLAERIVALREVDGGFDGLDDLRDVEGINDARFRALLAYVTLNNPAPKR